MALRGIYFRDYVCDGTIKMLCCYYDDVLLLLFDMLCYYLATVPTYCTSLY